MSALIHLDELLSETVAVRSCNLVTRPTGAAIRDRLLLDLRHEEGDAQLDFSRVGVVDYSCADEVVAKLLAMLDQLRISRVLLIGVHPHHAEAIDQALDRQGMTVIAIREGEGTPCLLGLVPVDCLEVFRALTALGRASVEVIAEALTWPPARTESALTQLVHRRCALAHADASFELGAFT